MAYLDIDKSRNYLVRSEETGAVLETIPAARMHEWCESSGLVLSEIIGLLPTPEELADPEWAFDE
jgi:hypothetical protein